MSSGADPAGIEWSDALVLQGGRLLAEKTAVVCEVPLNVFANGKKMAVIACTGNYPEELAVGYLYSEGIIRNAGDIINVEMSVAENTVRITCMQKEGAEPERADAPESIASSGARGTAASTALRPFDNKEPEALKLTPERISMLMESMIAGAVLHNVSGGTHCAALADVSGIIVSREDIGRHNAIDMLAGYVLLNGVACEDKIIVRTGRVSTEIVKKIWNMGIRLVVSISVPTSSAVRHAAEAGMTLVCGVRGGKMKIYNGKGRIAT